MATNSKASPLEPLQAVWGTQKTAVFFTAGVTRNDSFLTEAVFHTTLTLERRRAERSRKPFILMLLDTYEEDGAGPKLLHKARTVLSGTTRETDLLGWYKRDAILGVIFTELGPAADHTITEVLGKKVHAALEQGLGDQGASKIAISVHVFPEKRDENRPGFSADAKLYPDLQPNRRGQRALLGIKRCMDIVGSGALLLLLSPVLLALGIIIKLTSQGPVLFEQERLGQFGTHFKCLKFRTMYVNSDSKIHRDYIKKFINGNAENEDATEPSIYKITSDPRVTPIGRFLRKFSLDELPQFWNVLRGEMSLVGPRPPVPYEFEIYDIWHRRRVLEVKPGITGLWQVSGRSRSRFDDMVRLDLRYCQCWSLWLDLRILAATPWAVLSGDGAY